MRRVVPLAVACVFSSVWRVSAQEPPSPAPEPPSAAETSSAVEELIVTAERRRTNLQKTPISITALSADTLRERGAVDLGGVAEATPNMQLTTAGNGSGGSSFAQVFIRGVGQSDFIITKDPAVGIYVDGVYLARAPGALLELLDIERIEVLRGPQGTLFGKNTAGGAISVITKQPEGELSGVAELRLGNYARRDLSGSFQVPIIERRLSLRASGMTRGQDGYYERLRPGAIDGRTADGNSSNVRSGRVSLRWAPSDQLDIVLAADGTVQRETATDYQAVSVFDSPNISLYDRLVQQPRGQRYDARWIPKDPWQTYSTSPSYNNTDVWGTSGTLTWDLGAAQLKSITAYRALRVATKADADGTPIDLVASDGIRVNQHQISQELQLSGNAWDSRLHWLLGLWYFQEKATDRQSSRQLVGLFEALESAERGSVDPPGMTGLCPVEGSDIPQCLGGGGNPANQRFDQTRLGRRELQGRSYAAFGHASLHITDRLSATAGARISREEKRFKYFETRPLQNNRVSFDNVRADPDWNVFTPKLGLEYQLSAAVLAYASYGLGFKAGGVNGRPSRDDLFTAFGPEWLTTYEVGAKSEWLERKLRVNLALFYSRYTDIQISRNTVDADGAYIRVEQNAGDARIFGLEAEATAAPVRGLQLGASVGYTHFELTSLLPQMAAPGTPLLSLKNQLPFTPRWVGNLSAAYRLSLGEAGFLTPRVDVRYSSSYFIDIDNTPEIAQGAYELINARLAYTPKSASWELYASATNLTQRAAIGSGLAAPANGSHIVSYRPPRMVFVGARFNFD
ncbi:MAG: TonB-dependent receptor [Polyangiales bacterium]